MAATTITPSSGTSLTPSTSSTYQAGGNKPPAWALVDFRDDSQVPVAATAPIPVTKDSASPASPTKRPSMASPQDFGFVKELGCGSWSTVMEAVHTVTSQRYAVKILSKAQLVKQKKVRYASVEKDALAKLSGTHPGIVKMYAAFQDESSLYFVLDLAPHGDLADLVKKYGSLSLRSARWYTAQIVDAVLWVHSKGIVHRDVKPENMLLDGELRVKLTDFGSAYIASDGDLSPRSSTFVGSAAYVSPELLNRASKTTSRSSDIWAIGCTLFFIVAGTPPFVAINDYHSFRKIEALDYTFIEGFYETAKDLVQRLLVLDPSDRLGVEPKSSPSQLREHAFFAATVPSPHSAVDTSPIRWDSLWTDPPVPPETGIVPPSQSASPDDAAEDNLWDNVVHEFSLVNVRSPNDGPISPWNTAATGAPVDVPPDVVPCEVVETIQPSPRSDNVTADDVDDPGLREKDWTNVVPSGETIRRAALVTTPIRKGLVKHPRACALLLTCRPRVLCVLLDDKKIAAKCSDVKHTLEIGGRASSASLPKSQKNEKQGVVTACKIEQEQRRLVLRTGDKDYVYEFSDDRSFAWWAREIPSLVSST